MCSEAPDFKNFLKGPYRIEVPAGIGKTALLMAWLNSGAAISLRQTEDLRSVYFEAAPLRGVPLEGPINLFRIPTNAELLLRFLLPISVREQLIGDLAEEFQEVTRFGHRKAILWYWFQALRSILALCWPSLKKVGTLALAGKFAHEVLRRIGLG